MVEPADTAYPVHELIARRWSPYVFAQREVGDADLAALFEAARWAPSSYNEQPWRFAVARRGDRDAFAKLLSCLVEPNQAWAKDAAVLAIGIISRKFAKNGKPNAAAEHDLGLAAAQLTLEATARGLAVHQMIGILPDRAADVLSIPADHAALTALAIGYAGDPAAAGEMGERDAARRGRRPLSEWVFGAEYGKPAPFVSR